VGVQNNFIMEKKYIEEFKKEIFQETKVLIFNKDKILSDISKNYSFLMKHKDSKIGDLVNAHIFATGPYGKKVYKIKKVVSTGGSTNSLELESLDEALQLTLTISNDFNLNRLFIIGSKKFYAKYLQLKLKNLDYGK